MLISKIIFTLNPQNLYTIGARRIGVTSLPPLGCLPAAVTLFGGGNNNCVERLNADAVTFNKKVGDAAKALKNRHSDLKLVIFDIYNPLLDLIKNPANSGMCQLLSVLFNKSIINTAVQHYWLPSPSFCSIIHIALNLFSYRL
jgi:phospholipase/lecithinase/hemolysin